MPDDATDRAGVVQAESQQLIPPEDCVMVRMYRIGHGDCFLLAFPGDPSEQPVYVLIDCGYKPGSSKYIGTTAQDVTRSIRSATKGCIDLAIITHEHQDHVNAITETNFAGITIGETWFAWTEDPEDDAANDLRKKFNDRLSGLMEARNRMAVDPGSADKVRRIDDFLAFELGGEEEDFNATTAVNLLRVAAGAERSQNKRAMSLFKRLSGGNVKYLRPHEKAYKIARAEGVRVFPLGPPRDAALLQSLDPEGDEEFRLGAFSSTPTARYFAATVGTLEEPGRQQSPFASRYRVARNDALGPHAKNSFWQVFYGSTGTTPIASTNPNL